ncbi:MAG TPA: DUF2905 domain-containing protein [Bacillota bacterium]
MESPFAGLGKVLVICGGVLILAGLLLYLGGRIPGLGRLPGDFMFKKGNVTVYLPLGTSLLLSIILTILFSLFSRR